MNIDDVKKWMKNLPIKSKLLYGYLFTFLFLIIISNSILYLYVRTTISKNIERELSNSTLALQNMINTTTRNAIFNHLKVIAEKNLDIIIGLYHQNIPEKEAKKRAAKILTSQIIGETGYLYSLNSQGVIQAHPDKKLVGKNLSSQNFIQQQIESKNGYLEFRSSGSNKKDSRQTVLYNGYFGPWDWIVSASSYRSELNTLINQEELGKSILTKQFGKTGYAFVMDSKGNLVIHPKLTGDNIYDSEDSNGRKFIQEICKNKTGRIIYPWQNPGEMEAREKLVFYDYIPEMDWIIATTAYLDEFRKPLRILRFIILFSLAMITTLVFIITWQLSDTITKPIKYLMAGMKAASNGDFSTRLSPKSVDELGQLESYFNTFITQVQESNTRLHESEKGFRSIFENSVEGIFQFDIEGNILKFNPSFVSMLGYNSGQALLDERANLRHDYIVKRELWNELLELVISERVVKGLELQIYKKSGAIFWCLLNARGIFEPGSDKIVLIEGFLSDINDKKVVQEGQEKLMEDLEERVDERTIELSNRISELEHRDRLNQLMGEMGDMLQSCRSIDETFPVINQYLKIMFPEDSCSLYLHDRSKQIIDQVVPPPTVADPFISITDDSCWALRQSKNYLFKKTMDQGLTCDHIEEAPNGYICIPLIAHGVTTGLLHIVFQDGVPADSTDSESSLERKTRVCSKLAEHLSMALANLSLQEKLKLKSIQDSLTGLANRRHMEEILQRQFYRMLRYNTHCSIIMLDVDHFKHFNDTYGHDLGDLVLKELGAYLKNNCRGEDLACRYGGEEFIIILVNTEINHATKKAEKIRAEIAETISIPYLSENLHITVSIGVAASPTHGQNVTELVKSADNALYVAKHNGRNRVEVAQNKNDAHAKSDKT